MVADDSESTGIAVLDQSFALLEYLSAVAREVQTKPVRDVNDHEALLWSSEVPGHLGIKEGRHENGLCWLEVPRISLPDPVDAPDHLTALLEESETLKSPHRVPTLNMDKVGSYVGELQDGVKEVADSAKDRKAVKARVLSNQVVEEFQIWLEKEWKPWAEEVRPLFEARRLYEHLYELKLRFEAHSASLEIVWGHLVLSYKAGAGETVIAPMLTANAVIEVDEDNGAIRVRLERDLELELDAVEGTSLTGIEALTQLQAEVRREPLDVWQPDLRLALRRQLLAPLGVNAELYDSKKPAAPIPVPRVNDGWVLFMRKRPVRQQRFYGELAHKIREEQFVPEALASVVADTKRVDSAIVSLGRDVDYRDRTADRLMMPLPANPQQERIVKQLANSRGVTVQGPPGTGKSHTIVNLVSHLVANGKRVLVTAENEQALTVLRDKIPSEIRDLSIAVLESTPAAMEDLRTSAQSMQDRLSALDVREESRRIAKLEERIDSLRLSLGKIDKRLAEALRSEHSEYTLPSGPQKAPEVAAWLSENRDFNTIPDAVPSHAGPFPLTLEELQSLAKILRSISTEDWEHSLLDLPTDSWLPTGNKVKEIYDRLDELRANVTKLEDQGLQIEVLDGRSQEDVKRYSDLLKHEINELSRISGVWERDFAGLIRAHKPAVGWVMQNNPQIRENLRQARALANDLAGYDVKIPEGDPNLNRHFVKQWSERLSAGKRISWFASKGLKQFFAAVRVDDYQVRTQGQLDLVQRKIEFEETLKQTHKLMGQAYPLCNIPVPELSGAFLFQAEETARQVDQVHRWWAIRAPELLGILNQLFQDVDPLVTVESLSSVAELLDAAIVRFQERELSESIRSFSKRIAVKSRTSGASNLWSSLLCAYELGDYLAWTKTQDEAQTLLSARTKVIEAQRLLDQLRENGAPRWADEMLKSRGSWDTIADPHRATLAWEVAKARSWLSALHAKTDIETLMVQSHEQARELQRVIVDAASRSSALKLKKNMKDRQRRALETWLTAIKRMGKGTGKAAPRYQAAARDALPEAMGAVPIWIMPLYRVMENFDPRVSELFDVVIVDESSQCDLLTLGVLALGKKSVIVGDDKQTTPGRVGIATDRIGALQDQYLQNVPEAKLLTLEDSLYSISARAFSSTIALKEHFRSVPEIIDFSNKYYGGSIEPLREVSYPEIGDPIKVVYLADAVSTSIGSHRVNLEEAEAIADRVAQCIDDPNYDGLTFGVVTMMSGPQAQRIQDLIRERIGDEQFEKRKLRVGNPPIFQGDERNVIFISMVAHDNSFAATRLRYSQWANVAFSRARDQVWVFHSMDHLTLHHEDERRAMIDYALSYQRRDETRDLFEQTDSKFEEDVLAQMLKRNYLPTPQYQVGRYRIDFVIEVAKGERLAIECDGDAFHGPDKWEEDVRRQRVLERLGWNFWRIRASEYYLDPEAAMQPLWERLEKMKLRAEQVATSAKLRDSVLQENRLLSLRHEVLDRSLGDDQRPHHLATARELTDRGVEGSLQRANEDIRPKEVFEKSMPPRAEHSGSGASRTEPVENESTSIQAQREHSPLESAGALPKEAALEDGEAHSETKLSVDAMTRSELDSAWVNGTAFQLKSNGNILRLADESSLEVLVGVKRAEEIRTHMSLARPKGGRFRLDPSGLLLTRLNGEVRVACRLPRNVHSLMLDRR